MTLLPLLFSLVACQGDTKPATPAPATPAPAAPAAAPTAAAEAPSAGETVTGTVLETLGAPGYTYLRLKTDQGEKWAAIPETTLTVGQTVTLDRPMVMTNFNSKTLNRTFDEIYFAKLAGDAGSAGAAPSMPASMPGMPGMPAAAPTAGGGSINPDLVATPGAAPQSMAAHIDTSSVAVDVAKNIPKAEGADGHTVAEVWAQRKALSGKTVAVRGQVVKVNNGIMGRNWVHLRDGSGSTATKDDDIVVTTTDTVAVGDIVLAAGTAAADKDFGNGFGYPVLVESAKLTK